jgi:predicted Rossmann fold flavoprotein
MIKTTEGTSGQKTAGDAKPALGGAGVAVVGGGAAGMRAAAAAAELGARVRLFEKNTVLGKKLRITGKGRCNVTNDCPPDEFMAGIPANSRFLWSALCRFSPKDTINLFERLGVPLKTERGRRVFPVSDRAADIAGALIRDCRRTGVEIVREKVISLEIKNQRIAGLATERGRYDFDAVIVSTGGMSYPLTGSDGDGYKFARAAGHHVTDISPSLVPIICEGDLCASMQGLALKNVALTVRRISDGKALYSDFGELLFTHYGMSGPMILSASAHIHDIAPGRYEASIDLKPALDEATLDARLRSDFAKYSNRNFENSLSDLLPRKMIPTIVHISGIEPTQKVHSITREERHRLLNLLKDFRIKLRGFRPLAEAIITRGGVDTREISSSTMESKLISGLYFAGEVLDVDGYTGGYNLQIAFSTGTLAGESAVRQLIISQNNK